MSDAYRNITCTPSVASWLLKAVLKEQGCKALLVLRHVVPLCCEILPLQKLCPAFCSITCVASPREFIPTADLNKSFSVLR